MAGAFYLGVIAAGVVTLGARSMVLVGGDAAATAANFLAAEALYRLSVAAELVAAVCYLGVAAFLDALFGPVSWTVSRLGAFFALTGCAIGAAVAGLVIALRRSGDRY